MDRPIDGPVITGSEAVMSHKMDAAKAAKRPAAIPERLLNLTQASDLGRLGKFAIENIDHNLLVDTAVNFIRLRAPFLFTPQTSCPPTNCDPLRQMIDQVLGEADEPLILPRAVLDGEVADLGVLPRSLLAAHHLILPDNYHPKLPVSKWLCIWLPKVGTEEKSLGIDAVLGIDRVSLEHQLTELTRDHPEIARLLWSGKLHEAWTARAASCVDHGSALLRDFAVVLSVIQARLRMGLIRQLGVAPLTEHLATGATWQSRGAAFSQAVQKPAGQLRMLIADGPLVLAASQGAPLSTMLSSSHLLLSPSLREVYAAVETRLMELGVTQHQLQALDPILRANVTEAISPLTELTTSADRADCSGRQTFVDERFGLPATHAAVVVAASLLESPRLAGDCLANVAVGRAVPSMVRKFPMLPSRLGHAGRHRPGTHAISVGALRTITEWLRRVSASDHRACQRTFSAVHDSAPSKQMVGEALAGFRGGGLPAEALQLTVDPACWFQ